MMAEPSRDSWLTEPAVSDNPYEEAGWYSLDDPNLPKRFAHLVPDAPTARCSGCGRSTWSEFGQPCSMLQPDDSTCTGRFSRNEGT